MKKNKLNFRKYKLNQLGHLDRGRSRYRPRNHPSLYGGDYPFIQTGEVKASNLYINKFKNTYNEKGLRQSKLWPKETLCITIAANIAETAILNFPSCFPDSIVGFIANDKLTETKYIKYYIDYIKTNIQNISHGTTQDNLSLKKLLLFDFLIPNNLNVQKKIVSFLSNYDRLIENNIKRIKLLEELAINIYQEWFLNFHFPGHKDVRFKDTKFGRMPEGWNIESLGNFLVALESGKRPKGGIDRSVKEIPSIGAENIDGIANHNFEKEKYVSYDFYDSLKKGIVRDGDVGIYKDGAFIGKSTYFGDGFPHKKFCVNEHVFLLRTDNINITQKILYLWLQQESNINQIISLNSNSAQPGINQQDVGRLKILIADKLTTNKFDNLISPFFNTILNLAKKNLVLKKQKDLLLPYLISGKIDTSNLNIKISTKAA